jgi:hypothetical protein
MMKEKNFLIAEGSSTDGPPERSSPERGGRVAKALLPIEIEEKP